MIDLAEILPASRESAISMGDLAELLHCSRREVRAAVERARRHGLPVVSSCDPNGGGYWIASSAADATDYINAQRARAATAWTAIHALEAAFREGEAE